MELDEKDRTILYNQYEILKILDKEQEKHYKVLQKIIENGYSHEYYKLCPSSIDPLDSEIAEFVWDVFRMYDILDISYIDLDEKQQDLIEKWRIEFRGYDGNNETEYLAYADFVLRDLNTFASLWDQKKDLNSHMPRLEYYRRKLAAWQAVREDDYSPLDFDQIKQIAEA